ncbi:MAG TPA: NAD(P)/FAD-dependent oxidoreductase [Candidatus Sulfotelmatobacter sp.]|nr:NAD(P)/FAD-dependent oxidoreductase [Candidatus Sulfotelmatobacter sp.]
MSCDRPIATDIFVIGGGPAGLAAAIAARQRGLRVIVADGAQPPIDKACGEGLLPDGLAALSGLGIHLSLADAHPFCGIRFVGSDRSSEAAFPGNSCGLAVRRTYLHRIMTERAEQLGADLLWKTAVTGISADGVHMGKNLVRTRWIVGADGCNSRVRHWAGLDRGSRFRSRYAFRRHYRVAPWSDHMEVYWGDYCQGYATAVSREQVCVALASHDPNLRLEEGLRSLPRLRARLDGAEPVSAERGALTGNRRLNRVWRNNVALIGDASGMVDAITGEGLGLAFSQAAALAESLDSGDLSRYQAQHRRLRLRPTWMARLMLTLDGRPHLQRRTMQTFQKRPEIFRHLLELHVGAASPLHVAFDGLTLGWGLLTAQS